MGRILLLEPNSILAQTYGAALEHNGHDVEAVDSAQDALTKADESSLDLIILELQLAAHNGVEFLYEFRSYPDWQSVPVLVHTLIPPGEFRDNPVLLQELQVTDYLYKPQTSLRQLLNSVENCLAAAPA